MKFDDRYFVKLKEYISWSSQSIAIFMFITNCFKKVTYNWETLLKVFQSLMWFLRDLFIWPMCEFWHVNFKLYRSITSLMKDGG